MKAPNFAARGEPQRPASRLGVLQLHNPATWVLAVLLIVGVRATMRFDEGGARAFTTVAVVSTVLLTLYAIPWLALILHRELFSRLSRQASLLAFAWGALVATAVLAVPANDAMLGLLCKLVGTSFAGNWGAAISASWVEETAKALGVVLVLMLLGRRIRSPYELMIVGAFSGLGFQISENWHYALAAASSAFGQHALAHAVVTLFVRCVMVGLWSHAMYSAMVAGGIGFLVGLGGRRQVGTGLAVLAAGPALHFLWDSPLFADLGVGGLAIKVAVATVVYVVIQRVAVQRARAWVADALAPEVARGTLTSDEIDALSTSYGRRKRHWKQVRKQMGKAAAEIERAFQRAVTDLADALADSGGVDTPEVVAARAEVARLRAARDGRAVSRDEQQVRQPVG